MERNRFGSIDLDFPHGPMNSGSMCWKQLKLR
jgi:hypothetical protein